MTTTTLTPKQQQQLTDRGISRETLDRQLEIFSHGPYRHNLLRPCTVGDGVRRFEQEEQAPLLEAHNEAAAAGRVMKFVPASGAATRMFRDLLEFLDENSDTGRDHPTVATFLERLEEFAFGSDLEHALGGESLAKVKQEDRAAHILETLLTGRGLQFAELPKGLIKFHRVGDERRTAFESHLVEAALSIRSESKRCQLHFTVSKEHADAFRELLERVRSHYEERYDIHLDVSFSSQHPSTDTVALDTEGDLFRLEDGSLLLRPGGHGALLRNLSECDGDIIYIKNIDNIAPETHNDESVRWKKVLIGHLVRLEGRVHDILKRLDADDVTAIADGIALVTDDLDLPQPPGWDSQGRPERVSFLRERLNRPLRVCGMVPDEGATGGKPFWVEGPDGTPSAQIVEGAEVDLNDPAQKDAWERGTHFNPVKIACAVRDYQGRPFDLEQFVNDDAWFIAEKSHRGRPLKALEYPGLWNGSMARWNTVFVEVPLATFNPVKKVTDLLNPVHLGKKG